MTTENLLIKIEEKVSALLFEIEKLHTQIRDLQQENTDLKSVEHNHAAKLEGLISLLDVFDDMTAQVSAEPEKEEAALLAV